MIAFNSTYLYLIVCYVHMKIFLLYIRIIRFIFIIIIYIFTFPLIAVICESLLQLGIQ